MTDTGVGDLLDRLRTALADRYAIDRKVGEGGMATVYFARDLANERDVAIKVLRPELGSSIGGDRFLREIRLASELSHPNILGLFDSGAAGDFLYFTMPFITGESLRDRLDREGQLPLGDALRITRQVGAALAFAHGKDIVHRDIKPENILLTGDVALVADFGIARAVTQAGGERLTRTGMAVGTPIYMSPEQASGDRIDGRSDLYSLACVLYEMLVGQPPFTGNNPMTLMARHSMEAVPSVQLVRQTVPDRVEDALMKALAKSPADRFQKADEFIASLDGAESAPATMRRSGQRKIEQKKQNKWLIRAAIAALAVAGGGLAWWKTQQGPAIPSGPPPNQLAVLYFDDRSEKRDQAFLAEGITEALINELSQVKVLQVISRNGVAPLKGRPAALDSVARALQVGTIVQGTVRPIGDSVRVDVSLSNADGKEVGNARIVRPHTELISLQDSLAVEVSNLIRRRIGQQVELRQSRAGTRNVQAWELEQQTQQRATGIDSLIALGNAAAAEREMLRVDSAFAEVEKLDSHWSAPVVRRAWLNYWQARVAGASDKTQYGPWIDRGMALAQRAVSMQPADAPDADALEVRGALRYLKWLLNLGASGAEMKELLNGAEEDLRAAVSANASQASAWAMLAHLLNAKSETSDGKLAALRAYAADPYLKNASVVVWRLFQNSLDLNDRAEAGKWCNEGMRRFPDDPHFVECQIWTYALRGEKPDIPRAWKLLDEYAEKYPAPRREYATKRGSMIVAMALARAELPDSAKAVATRSRLDAGSDPTRELSFLEAIVRTMAGDKDEAMRLLRAFYAANPQQLEGLANDETWWFTDLREDSRYKALVGSS